MYIKDFVLIRLVEFMHYRLYMPGVHILHINLYIIDYMPGVHNLHINLYIIDYMPGVHILHINRQAEDQRHVS